MASVRDGNRSALLVVDVQAGVVAKAWETSRVVANIAYLVTRARQAGAPVIWVQHHDDELVRDSDAWQWVPELVPTAGEVRIYKQFNSAFEGTALDAELAARGIAHIVLTGAATNWCIRATAYAALDRGYDLTLVSDAHTTKSIPLEDGARIEAAHMVRELNIAMTWLGYPGRKTTTAPTDGVVFGSQ